MRRSKGVSTILALLALAIVLAAAACGGDDDDDTSGEPAATGGETTGGDTGDGEGGFSLYMIPKNVGNPVFDLTNAGMQEAAAELGDTTEFNGSTEADAQQQVEVINAAIAQEPDALLISANDPDALVPALESAEAKGIQTVTFDSDVNPDARIMFASTPSPTAVGETQIEMCGSQIDYTGEIAILSAAATATNQNAWIEVMETTLEDPKYAEMELVTTVYGDDDPTKSTEEAQGLLQAYPDLKCIIAPTTVGIAAAAQVVTQQDKCEAVIVTGLGLPSEMREFVKSGCVHAERPLELPGHRLPRGLRRSRRPGRRDHGRGRRDVRGGSARRDHHRGRRHRVCAGAARVHSGEHRRLRLLVVGWGEAGAQALPPLHRFE